MKTLKSLVIPALVALSATLMYLLYSAPVSDSAARRHMLEMMPVYESRGYTVRLDPDGEFVWVKRSKKGWDAEEHSPTPVTAERTSGDQNSVHITE